MVDAIWTDMELRYPPAVEPLPTQATNIVASANRLSIFLRERTPSWCVLHEIAHSMTSTAQGFSDGHGEIFMGVYIRLLVRYLRFDQAELTQSLDNDKIAYRIEARPVFADDPTGAATKPG